MQCSILLYKIIEKRPSAFCSKPQVNDPSIEGVISIRKLSRNHVPFPWYKIVDPSGLICQRNTVRNMRSGIGLGIDNAQQDFIFLL